MMEGQNESAKVKLLKYPTQKSVERLNVYGFSMFYVGLPRNLLLVILGEQNRRLKFNFQGLAPRFRAQVPKKTNK